MCVVFFFQAEDGIRDLVRSRGLGDVYKRQVLHILQGALPAQGVIGYKAYSTNRSGNRFLVHLFLSLIHI